MMSWVWAPLSDHEAKVYVFLPLVCGEIALMLFLDPTITVRVKVAVACVFTSATCNPPRNCLESQSNRPGIQAQALRSRETPAIRGSQLELEVRRILMIRSDERATSNARELLDGCVHGSWMGSDA